jgi:hypothetical protein
VEVGRAGESDILAWCNCSLCRIVHNEGVE